MASGDNGPTVIVGESEPVDLPADSLKTLHRVVHALAAGGDPMLTTTEAADFLGVSRLKPDPAAQDRQAGVPQEGNRHLVPVAALDVFKAERDPRLDELATPAAAEENLGLR